MARPPDARPMVVRALVRGLVRRCPRCGSSGVFRGWFTLCDECPGCGLLFAREEGFWLGAFVMNFGVTEVALGLYLLVAIVATLPSPPPLPIALGGTAVSVLVPVAFYPSSKTLWCAVDLTMLGRTQTRASALTSTAARSSTPATPRRPAP